MQSDEKLNLNVNKKDLLTFFAITLFYFFESAQMSYFNVLAPGFLSHGIYQHEQIASLSAAYYYGDMIRLLPVGFALDRFPLRSTLLWTIFGIYSRCCLAFYEPRLLSSMVRSIYLWIFWRHILLCRWY
jgi:MFS family permease